MTTMTTTTTRTVAYPADGLTMIGHLALPAGVDRRPAVLLGPEGTGLSDVERRRADALAELGYVALAFDLHGGRYLSDAEEMLARCLPLLADPDRMRGIGHAALDVLRTEPRTDPDRIAAVGYGTGGAVGLELGRDGVPLRAIGTVNALTTGRPGEAARIRCPVWAGVGSEDPIMPPAQRNAFTAEMQAAGVDWRLTVYGGALHAFHHPPVDHPTVAACRPPPAARAASLARHRRPARRVSARVGGLGGRTQVSTSELGTASPPLLTCGGPFRPPPRGQWSPPWKTQPTVAPLPMLTTPTPGSALPRTKPPA